MKKDIPFPKVEGVQLAIARHTSTLGEEEWGVFLINHNDFQIEYVMVTSKGYGYKGSTQQKTTTLRHSLGSIQAHSFAKVEKIVPDVFHLCNEYWLSYYVNEQLFDKKFLFMPGSISEEHMTKIEALDMQGVLHS